MTSHKKPLFPLKSGERMGREFENGLFEKPAKRGKK